jgi:hypothetical protein
MVPYFDGTRRELITDVLKAVAMYALTHKCVQLAIPAILRPQFMRPQDVATYAGPTVDTEEPAQPPIVFGAADLTFKARLERFLKQSQHCDELTMMLAQALGPAVIAKIGDTRHGIHGWSCMELFTALMDNYGALKDKEIVDLRAATTYYDRDAKVSINKQAQDKAYMTLSDADRTVTAADKLTNLKSTLKSSSNFTMAKNMYEMKTETHLQTYESLWEEIQRAEDAGNEDQGSFSAASRQRANAAVIDSACAASDLTMGARMERLEKLVEKGLEKFLGHSASSKASGNSEPNMPNMHPLKALDPSHVHYCGKCSHNPSHTTETCSKIKTDYQKERFSKRTTPQLRNKDVMECFNNQKK